MKASESNEQLLRLQKMMDYLGLPLMSQRAMDILYGTNKCKMDNKSFLEEILSAEYDYKNNKILARDLRLGRLASRDGDYSLLYSHNGRLYSESSLEQVKSFYWIEKGINISVFGKSNAGKSFFLVSVCPEACNRGYRTLYCDFSTIIDELWYIKKAATAKYYKKLEHYVKMPILLIDDFLSVALIESQEAILFQLIKRRHELKNPTIIATQYDPSEWVTLMSQDTNLSGNADAIRRRLVDDAYLVTIEAPGEDAIENTN